MENKTPLKKFKVGLFVGRFQPLHSGHMKVIDYADKICTRLVIGVGSSQISGTSDNPLSSEVRIRIIRAALKGSIDPKRVEYLEIPDFGNDDAWFVYIAERIPKIDVVFTGNALVKKIFTENGIKVHNIGRKDDISGTKVR